MRKPIQPKVLKAQGQSVFITIEKQSHIIKQMRHYKNESLVLLWNYQQSWQSSHWGILFHTTGAAQQNAIYVMTGSSWNKASKDRWE